MDMKTESKKRVDIVSIKLVRDSSVLYEPRKISCPSDAVNLCRKFLEDLDREHMIAISLDIKNQPTAVNVVSIGTLNSALCHPREIFKAAVLGNSNSLIIAHGHPSGDVTPSKEDRSITKRLVEAGKILGIELVDHIIIGSNGKYTSFKEMGEI